MLQATGSASKLLLRIGRVQHVLQPLDPELERALAQHAEPDEQALHIAERLGPCPCRKPASGLCARRPAAQLSNMLQAPCFMPLLMCSKSAQSPLCAVHCGSFADASAPFLSEQLGKCLACGHQLLIRSSVSCRHSDSKRMHWESNARHGPPSPSSSRASCASVVGKAARRASRRSSSSCVARRPPSPTTSFSPQHWFHTCKEAPQHPTCSTCSLQAQACSSALALNALANGLAGMRSDAGVCRALTSQGHTCRAAQVLQPVCSEPCLAMPVARGLSDPYNLTYASGCARHLPARPAHHSRAPRRGRASRTACRRACPARTAAAGASPG